MAYSIVTNNRTVNFSSDASTANIIYYCGNADSNGNITGNVDKSALSLSYTSNWATCSLNSKDSTNTAKQIKCVVLKNTGSSRSFIIYLNNTYSKTSNYITILQSAGNSGTVPESKYIYINFGTSDAMVIFANTDLMPLESEQMSGTANMSNDYLKRTAKIFNEPKQFEITVQNGISYINVAQMQIIESYSSDTVTQITPIIPVSTFCGYSGLIRIYTTSSDTQYGIYEKYTTALFTESELNGNNFLTSATAYKCQPYRV